MRRPWLPKKSCEPGWVRSFTFEILPLNQAILNISFSVPPDLT
jgi:hypothetical protein